MEAPTGRTDASQSSGDPAPQASALDLTNTHAPFVKTLTGVILRFVKIRDGLKTNKERCREIIDKVLRLSRWIYDKLAAIAKSGERAKGDLAEVENSLISGANTLTAILGELEKIHARSRFNTFLGRGVEDLNILDRAVDDLEKRLLRDIVFDMKLQQGMPVSGKNMDPTLHPPTDNLVHVLPPKPHLMIEREDHLKHALDILLRPETSRIAIIGGGGFGKTTLALTILHDPKIVERYQSQYFLSCEGMLDIDTLLLKFGSMLGLNVAPSVILASARRLLGTSTALACFDNFETPWEAFDTRTTKVEELLEFFADIPNLSLIITLRGEHHPSKVMWSRPLLPPLVTLSLDGAKDVLRNIASDHIIDEFTVQLLQAIDGIPLAVTLVSTLLRDGESSESLWGRWSADYTEVIHTGGDDHQSNLDRSIALSVYSLRMDKDVSDGYEPLSVFDICNTHFRDSSPEFVPMSKNEISPYHSSYDQMSLPRVDRTQPREANPSPLSSRASIVPVGEERSLITHANEHAMKEKTTEDSFLICPISLNHAKGNPFAYARLNNLSGQVRKEYTIGGGSFADVHMGFWVTDTTSIKVAIKELRSHIYGQADVSKLQKRLKREMRIWGNLDHPNIVPLLGVTSDFGKSIAMVCQWMNQGTLSEYLEKEKENFSLHDRLNICIAIARGLTYLHSQKVIHGDLSPANILMDNGTAHLSDFGLSNVMEELQGPSFCTSTVSRSTRWIAPELLLGSDVTTSCDVYSFASVAFYVITGMLPYSHLKQDHAIIAEIYRSTDKSPSRPLQSLLKDDCWELLTMCWATDPAKRPDINDVNRRLQQLDSFDFGFDVRF